MGSTRSARATAIAASLAPAWVGLAASVILAVDYARVAPVFCSEGGGCDAVRHTAFASLLGIPTPFFGVAGFGAIGIAALLPGRSARALQLGLAGFAALVSAILFAIQVRIGRFCPYCCAADASGVASLWVALWRWRRPPDAAPAVFASAVGAISLAMAGLLPFAIGMRKAPGVPAVILHELGSAATGQVAVVDFVDFECPFCRMTDAALEPLLFAHKDRVHLVRRQVPLRSHAHARDAARAACCGEELGRGDAMASALFQTNAGDLTPEGCEKVAERLGLSLPAYRACVADPQTDHRIDADRQEFKDAGGYALPTIWIGDVPLVGAQSADTLAAALDHALARAGG